jgi:hypothetical protein
VLIRLGNDASLFLIKDNEPILRNCIAVAAQFLGKKLLSESDI